MCLENKNENNGETVFQKEICIEKEKHFHNRPAFKTKNEGRPFGGIALIVNDSKSRCLFFSSLLFNT
jgi:hypothetical protein